MKKRILQFCFTTLTLGIIYLTNVSYSSGPPNVALTNGCYCHSASANSNTLVTTTFNGGNMQYFNGQTYPIAITVNSSSNQMGAGFIMSVNIGTLSLNSSGVAISGLTAYHTSPKAMSGAFPSSATWMVNWTAPATGNTPLQISAVGNAVNLANGNLGDQWNFSSNVNVPLPISVLTLSAIHSENKTQLIWESENETNISHYNIQVSEHENDFKTIESITASKAQNETYNYIDEQTYHATDIQYRIVALDINGHQKMSNVVKVSNKQSKNANIYPNAITQNEYFTLQLNDNKQIGSEFLILNLSGQVMHREIIETMTTNVSTSNLSSGLYVATLKLGNQTEILGKILVK